MREKAQPLVLLSGKGSSKEKRELLRELTEVPAEEPLILVAIGRYVGEGFALPRLDLIETLCGISEAQNMLKLMVSPSKRDMDRALAKFCARCEIYMCNSCNMRDYDRMCVALEPLYAAYKYAEAKHRLISSMGYIALCMTMIF